MPATQAGERPLFGLAARWPEMDRQQRREATAPARAGLERRFVARARAEAEAAGEAPTDDRIAARAAELRSAHYRALNAHRQARDRADREELARLRRLVGVTTTGASGA